MIFQQLDLNLLRLFEAVMQSGSVTRAASQLGLTQSAASNGLARLRDVLGDPLFLRRPGGVEPTARARELAGPVSEALAGLRAVLDGRGDFDPKAATGEVVIGTSDHAELVLGPCLAAFFEAEAPGLALTFRHCDRSDALDLVDAGKVELAMGVLPEPPARMVRQFLLREGFTVLMRASHPAAAEPGLGLDCYLRHRHLLVSAVASRTGAVDRLLAEKGLVRRLGPVASHHLAAGAMLAASDLFLTVPDSVGRVLADAFHLVARAVPLDLPAVRLAATWARRNEEAPQHRWLRHALARLAQQVPKG
ncbi:LysR substrate-binding domain-containing protein [Zavarzinia sp.]|uniref:LysR family transcriptional regulator n=1 Tax=Zavarzinia sp. TaxID=2027920 RepID=UPI003566CFB9